MKTVSRVAPNVVYAETVAQLKTPRSITRLTLTRPSLVCWQSELGPGRITAPIPEHAPQDERTMLNRADRLTCFICVTNQHPVR